MEAEGHSELLQVSPPSFGRQSLVHACLDIGRVLAQRDGVTFRAQGTCMYPTVRPGDVLTIKPLTAADISIGDIAVCRTADFLFSHRVIDKGEREGRAYIITRPDRSHQGGDNPTFDENLLGVVTAIKRNGKSVPLEPAKHKGVIRYYYKKRLDLIETKARLKLKLSEFLSHKDISIFYRPVVKLWFHLARPRLTFVVQVPLNATLGDAVFHRFQPETFHPEKSMKDRKIMCWKIAVYINEGNEPAAWARFARDEHDKWRVAESHLRMRYRGAGLEVMLMSRAVKILERDIQ